MAKRSNDTDGYGSDDKRKPRRRTDAPIKFDEYQFVRIELTADEKQDLKENYLPDLDYRDALSDLVITGYKLTIAQQKDQPTWIATLSCGDREDDNAALTLTARGSSVVAAVASLAYKVLVLAEDRPWRQVESERGGGYDDIG